MIVRAACGHDSLEVSSAMQKATRRVDTGVAGFFVLEPWANGHCDYVWKRLFTISAEDCFGIITKEIEALWQGYELVSKTATKPKGRVSVNKVVALFCEYRKNRDADHLQSFIYNREDIDIEKWVSDIRYYSIPVPDHTFDIHTRKGKKRGRTEGEFFWEEYKMLQSRALDLFDDSIQSN